MMIRCHVGWWGWWRDCLDFEILSRYHDVPLSLSSDWFPVCVCFQTWLALASVLWAQVWRVCGTQVLAAPAPSVASCGTWAWAKLLLPASASAAPGPARTSWAGVLHGVRRPRVYGRPLKNDAATAGVPFNPRPRLRPLPSSPACSEAPVSASPPAPTFQRRPFLNPSQPWPSTHPARSAILTTGFA